MKVMCKQMKILVTGGAGFIGSHLVDRLVKNNNVIVIDNLSSGKEEFVNKKAILIKEDLLNSEKICKYFEDINTVYHLAANPDVKIGAENTRIHLEQNIIVTYNVLEAMRKNNIKKIVFTSSSTVCGYAPMPTPED